MSDCYVIPLVVTKRVKFMRQTKNNDIEPLFGSNESYWFEFDFKIISGVVLRSLG